MGRILEPIGQQIGKYAGGIFHPEKKRREREDREESEKWANEDKLRTALNDMIRKVIEKPHNQTENDPKSDNHNKLNSLGALIRTLCEIKIDLSGATTSESKFSSFPENLEIKQALNNILSKSTMDNSTKDRTLSWMIRQFGEKFDICFEGLQLSKRAEKRNEIVAKSLEERKIETPEAQKFYTYFGPENFTCDAGTKKPETSYISEEPTIAELIIEEYQKMLPEERARITKLVELVLSDQDYKAIFEFTKTVRSPGYTGKDLRDRHPEKTGEDGRLSPVINMSVREETDKLTNQNSKTDVYAYSHLERALISIKNNGNKTKIFASIPLKYCGYDFRKHFCLFYLEINKEISSQIIDDLRSNPNDLIHLIRGLCIATGNSAYANVVFERIGEPSTFHPETPHDTMMIGEEIIEIPKIKK